MTLAGIVVIRRIRGRNGLHPLSILRWIKELFRDHTMDNFSKALCKGLREIGKDGRVSGWAGVVEIRGLSLIHI